MKQKVSLLTWLNAFFCTLVGISCLLPILHLLAISLSREDMVSFGRVSLWPVGFNWSSYEYILDNTAFWRASLVTLERLILGVPMKMLVCILAAYPLSKFNRRFRLRGVFVWYIFFTMLFSGGIIPWFIVVNELGLTGKIWALLLPCAVIPGNILLLLNFFRTLPPELEESALIDGAGQYRILFQIILPISKPAIATICVYSILEHWNSWFDGMLLMNSPDQYPLMTYLYYTGESISFSQRSSAELETMAEVGKRTYRAAQVFVSTLPMLVVYPFFQRYFTKGIVLGAVKG